MPIENWLRRRGVSRACAEVLEPRALLASVSSTTPYNGQSAFGIANNLTVTFGSAMNPTTLTTSRVTLRDANGITVPASLSYNATSRVLSVDPTPLLTANSSYYTLRITGGTSGVFASDNTPLPSDVVVNFTCGTPAIGKQTVFSGLDLPTNIEFSPDGRVFISEKSGIIKMFDSLTDTTPTVVADFRTKTHNFWDRGMLGMALDPQFTSGKPYVYVLYTYDGAIGGSAPTWGTVNGANDSGGPSPTGTGANVSGRLSRFAVDANGVMTGSEQVLVHDWNGQFPSHSIGDLKFGPDGYLYASAGDGANFNTEDYGQFPNGFGDPTNQGGALRAQDILSDADPAGLDGTIIRIDPNTGAAAPGNPYSGSADANKRRIIANGLRNPFRLTFKPGTSELWVADTGWNTWEEINRIPNAADNIAENFGWPAYEGPNRQEGYDALNLPLLENFYANPSAHTTPWFSYNHADKVVAGSNEPTGGSSPTGIAYYNGGAYPTAYQGALFFADFSRQRVYVMYTGPDGQLNQASRQVFDTGAYVELAVGPGGDLFAADLYNGTIVRYVATGYNLAPVANVIAYPTVGSAPLTVYFDARASRDPDGTTLVYAWDLDGDGNFNDGTSSTPNKVYTAAGDTTVKVRVTDAGGLSSVASIVIHVGNTPPMPVISLPQTTLRWSVGDLVNFAGSATDNEDGVIPASRLKWNLVLIHASDIDPSSTHAHTITSYTGVASGTFVAPDHEYPSWVELRLTATDSKGLSATRVIRLDPKTVLLTFTSSTPGLQMSFGGSNFTTPFTRTVMANSANAISALSPQTIGTTQYTFASWSDGGAANHSITAPQVATTYTATYNATPVNPTGTPTPPSGLTATVLTGPSVKLNWIDNANNETGFIIQRRYTNWIWEDLAITVGANTTTATDTTAYAGVSYEYRVAAKNALGTSAWSSGVTVDTGVVGAPGPAAPSGLAATSTIAARVDLVWIDNSTNETGFRIERRVPGGTFAALTTTAANVTNYADLTATAGATYEYRVIATATADSTPSNTATVLVAGGVGVPNAPKNLAATYQANNVWRLTWQDVSTNETGFRIQRRYSNWIWEDIATVGANVTAYGDAGTYAGTEYEYQILAIGPGGLSAPSNMVRVISPAAAAAALVASPARKTAVKRGSLPELA